MTNKVVYFENWVIRDQKILEYSGIVMFSFAFRLKLIFIEKMKYFFSLLYFYHGADSQEIRWIFKFIRYRINIYDSITFFLLENYVSINYYMRKFITFALITTFSPLILLKIYQKNNEKQKEFLSIPFHCSRNWMNMFLRRHYFK